MPERLEQVQRFPLAAAFALYTAAFLALASPWVLSIVAIPYDSASQFYPQLVFLARSLATGQSPFWTPNIYAGWPQIADPQSLIFSPLHFIVALLNPAPSQWLHDMLVFALLYAGGAGVILFFRDRGWHLGGALVAALAFAFGGSAASRIQHVGQIESLVYLPLALWMLAAALERSSWRCGLAAGVFAALIVLGRDQVALIEVYFLVGFVLWHWLDGADWRGRIVTSIKPLVAGAFAGAMIVTVPVILTALLAWHSNRPEIGYDVAVKGSLHPACLLMLPFADVFGASNFAREFWGPPSLIWDETIRAEGLYDAQNVGQIYAGALVIMALLGFAWMRGALWAREIRFFCVAAVITLLYALGKYTPAFQMMYELPGVEFYRRPADATFVFCALLAVIAGYLVHRWLSGTIPIPRRWQYMLSIAIVAGMVAVSLALAAKAGVLASTLVPLALGVGYCVAAVAVLALARNLARQSAIAAAAALVMFSVADLAWNNAPNESTGLPVAHFDAMRLDTTDDTVTTLKARLKAAAAPDRRDRVELVGIAYHWPNIGLIHDFDHLFGHNPLRLADFARATRAPDTVPEPNRFFSTLLPSYRSTLEDLFGVRFLVLGASIEKIDPSLKSGDFPLVARTKSAIIYENPGALPRVMLPTEWRKADFEALLNHGGWPDFDPRRTVLLDHAPAGALDAATAPGAVRILRYRNTEIEIEADAPGGGFVVLNDVWHPWWRARVDGQPSEILKANVLFRAVIVPPGKHVVRFTFHPFAGALAELREWFAETKVR